MNARYAARWYTLYPTNQWSSSYTTPVGTPSTGNLTRVYLYNPGPGAITIDYTTRVSNGSFAVAANTTYQFNMPQDSGARFASQGDEVFFAISAVGTKDSAYDWGFSLLPDSGLTNVAVVGWGPGSSNDTVNGSPVWVTPTAATTVYVDYKGDGIGPNVDPNGENYDAAYPLVALQSQRVYVPLPATDQTAMRLYTTSGVPISAAWGQDPAVAKPGNPYLDFGTTVLPFPVPVIRKSFAVITDTNPLNEINLGDIIEYTIEVDNKGLLPLGNLITIDTPPPALSYVLESTTRDGEAIADNVAPASEFPLDDDGYVVPFILRAGTTVFKYRAEIVQSGTINNTVSIDGYNISAEAIVEAPPTPTTQAVVAFTDAGAIPVGSYVAATDDIYVEVDDDDQNTDSGTQQTATATVENLTNGDLEMVALTETGNDTGIFRTTVSLPTSLSEGLAIEDGILNVAGGDSLRVTYVDPVFGDSDTETALIEVPTVHKQLYLNDDAGSQILNRLDPAVQGTPTASTAVLSMGAVALDDVSSGGFNSTDTGTVSHTTGGGSDRLMLVGISMNRATETSDENVTAVTYNGVALDLVGTRSAGALGTGEYEAVMWIYALVNPPAVTANVVVTLNTSSTDGFYVGVATFTGVDQDTPYGAFQSNSNASGTTISLDVTSAPGELVFDTVALRTSDFGGAGSPGAGQSQLWKTYYNSRTGAGASTEPGDDTVTMSWTSSSGVAKSIGAVSIKPAVVGIATTTFTQSPEFYQDFSMPSGETVSVQLVPNVTSGVMPADPDITVELEYDGNPIITLVNPTYGDIGGVNTLVWSGALGSNITIPDGEAIDVIITTNEPAVSYEIEYGSAAARSFVSLPTKTVIDVSSVEIHDAAYPSDSPIVGAANGSTVYIRTAVTDPFGSYDITSVDLTINGPGADADISVNLAVADVVSDDGFTKIYEYAWSTSAIDGAYDVVVVANEGTEGTITDTAAMRFALSFLDTGSPSAAAFTSPTFPVDTCIGVSVTEADKNGDALTAETIQAVVTSSSGDSELVTLTETGLNTGVFAFCLDASSSVPGNDDDAELYAPTGAVLTLTYTDPEDPDDSSSDTAMIPAAVPSVGMSMTLVQPADGQAIVGETVEFLITLVNNGNVLLANLELVNDFPEANLNYVSASIAPDSTAGGQLAWNNVGPMNNGEVKNITVTFTATSSANPANNEADVTGDAAASADTSVIITNPALRITQTVIDPLDGEADITDTVIFRTEVENIGDTVISDLPLEILYSAAYYDYVSNDHMAPDGTGAGSLVWDDITGGGSLNPSGVITIDLTLTVIGAGNPATVTATADYAIDINGDLVPGDSDSDTLVTHAASISGTVSEDADGDSAFSVGDVGLANVTIELFTDPDGNGDPGDGVLVKSTISGADGEYELLNLTEGDYVVVKTTPSGYASVIPLSGQIAVSAIDLVDYAADFLDYQPDPADYATISGRVWNDANVSGSDDGGEVGIANLSVELIRDLNGNFIADAGEPTVAASLTDANGSYTFFAVVADSYIVSKSGLTGFGNTPGNSDQIAVTVVEGATSSENDFFIYVLPTQVEFVQQPTDAIAGEAVAPAVTVRVLDDDDNPLTVPDVPITLTLTTGSGILSGTTVDVLTDGNGIATFADLSINLVGTKQLTASSPGLGSDVSSDFEITAAAPNQLEFGVHPTDAVAGATIAPAVTVRILDSFGNLTNSTADVEIELTTPNGAILGGDLEVAAIAGVATFGDLSVNLIGTYDLTASSAGLSDDQSDAFTITHDVADRYVILDPVDGTVDAPIPVTVQLHDQFGNLVTSGPFTDTDVTLVANGSATGDGVVDIVSGVGVLDLSNTVAETVNLSLNDSALTGLDVTSTQDVAFAHGAADRYVLLDPVDGTVDAPIPVTVQLHDQFGNLVTSGPFTDTDVTLVAGGSATGDGVVDIVSGVGVLDLSNTVAETVNLSLNDSALTGLDVTSTQDVVFGHGAANRYVILDPIDGTVDAPIPVTVQLHDQFGNLVTSGPFTNTDVTLVADGSATGDGVVDIVSGVGVLDLSNTVAETVNLSLNDSAVTGLDVTSTQDVVFAHGAAAQLALLGPITDLISGDTRDVTAIIQDAFGNTVSTGPESILAVTFSQTDGVGTVNGLTSVNASVGVAELTVTGHLAGPVELTATTLGPIVSNTLTFTVVHGAAVQLTLSGATTDLVAGTNRVLTATIRDAAGNPVISGVDSFRRVTFRQTNGSGSVTGVTIMWYADQGVAQATVTGAKPGTVQITATTSVLPLSASLGFTVVLGPPSQLAFTSSVKDLVSGTERELRVEVRDAGGNLLVADNGRDITFSKDGGAGTVLGLSTAPTVNGIARLPVIGELIGPITIKAADGSLPEVTSGFTVVHGALAQLTLEGDTDDLSSGATRPLVATLRDAVGNPITTGSQSTLWITFAKTDGPGSVTGLTQVQAIAGAAPLIVTGAIAGTVDLQASTTIPALADSLSFDVVTSLPHSLVLINSVDDLLVGDDRLLIVEIRDSEGNLINTDTGRTITFSKTGGPGAVSGLGTADTDNGVASLTVTGDIVGTITIEATDGALEPDSTTFEVVNSPPAGAVPGVIYVDFRQEPTVGDGRTWATAYHTLDEALATDLDSWNVVTAIIAYGEAKIWIAGDGGAGITYPTTTGHDIPTDVLIYGGFIGGLTGGFAGESATTERDGSGGTTVIDGRGTADSVIRAFDAQLLLDGLEITGGNASRDGGGVHLENGKLVLHDVTLHGNTAKYSGGALYVRNAELSADKISLIGNDARYYGGGLYLSRGTGTVTNGVFALNVTTRNGAAIYHDQANGEYRNCTITENDAGRTGQGGAISNDRNSTTTLRNSILWKNAGRRYPEIETTRLADMTVSNCVISGGFSSGANVSSTNPNLNADLIPGTGGSADDTGLAVELTDRNGDDRVKQDLGAYIVP